MTLPAILCAHVCVCVSRDWRQSLVPDTRWRGRNQHHNSWSHECRCTTGQLTGAQMALWSCRFRSKDHPSLELLLTFSYLLMADQGSSPTLSRTTPQPAQERPLTSNGGLKSVQDWSKVASKLLTRKKRYQHMTLRFCTRSKNEVWRLIKHLRVAAGLHKQEKKPGFRISRDSNHHLPVRYMQKASRSFMGTRPFSKGKSDLLSLRTSLPPRRKHTKHKGS